MPNFNTIKKIIGVVEKEAPEVTGVVTKKFIMTPEARGLRKIAKPLEEAYDEAPNMLDHLSYGIRSAMEDVPAHSNEPIDYETTINKAREIINRWKDDPDYKRMSEMIPQEVKDQKFNDIMNYIKSRK